VGTQLILRDDLRWQGVTFRQIDHRVESGQWVRLQRGVYLPAGVEITPTIRAEAAVAAVDRLGVAASHETAARVHGIDLVRSRVGEYVTMPRSVDRPDRPGLRMYGRDLPNDDMTMVDGVRVTTVARTLRDLLLDTDRLTAIWACEHAIRRELVVQEQIAATLAAARGSGRIGRARNRFGLVNARSESPLETGVRLTGLDADLPPFEVQIPITDDAGRELEHSPIPQRNRLNLLGGSPPCAGMEGVASHCAG